jgi:DNA-binding CsgD family transcriptional regulator
VISRKYVSPILKKLEQVRSRGGDVSHLSIPEIDDLIDYLEARDIGYEQRLRDLESAKHAAEEEAARAKEAYEKALSDYEIAQREIQSLADDRRHDIVLEDFEFFICNLGSLTPKEYSIYELYIEGKTAKEIMEILDIKENTMKFHNKNIYSKLGISSRKQLLKFAALKKQQETKGETTL